MISTRPPEKKLAHNIELFFFKAWYHITLDLLYIQCESCIIFFKLDLILVAINHDQQSYILLFLNFIFSFMNRFEHIPTRLIFKIFFSFSFWSWCPPSDLYLKVWINITLWSHCLDFQTFVKILIN
jgi:hypothetical protein